VAAWHTDVRHSHQLSVEVEIPTDQVSKVLSLQPPDRSVGLAADGRHPRLVTKQGHLAEILARTKRGNTARPPVFPGEHIDLAVPEDVESVARITLTYQRVATVKGLNRELDGEEVQLARCRFRE
jgi:hypothetical protein